MMISNQNCLSFFFDISTPTPRAQLPAPPATKTGRFSINVKERGGDVRYSGTRYFWT